MPALKRKEAREYWVNGDGLTLLSGWAREGLNNEQIASNMGIALSTFYKWQSDYKDFMEAIKKEKEVVDFEVENTALKIAMGYTQPVEEKRYTVNEQGVKKLTQVIIKDIYFTPNVAMLIFWLKNRMGDKWREKFDEKDMDTIKAIASGFEAISKMK